MATKQFMGGTAPLVDDQGDGTHYPMVKVVAEGQTATAIGAATDAAANADVGSFSLVALVKRGLAHLTTLITNVSTLLTRVPAQAIPGLLPVDTLGTPGDSLSDLAVSAATVTLNTAAFEGARRASIVATTAMRFTLTNGAPSTAPTATTGHLLLAGDRVDVDLPANPTLTVIRASGTGITTADGICNVMRLL